MKLTDLIQEIGTFEETEFFGPTEIVVIDSASKELCLTFPSQYKEFLATLGSGSISSESFIGLGGPRHLNVVWLTKTLRSKTGSRTFPKYLLPIRSDGYGNYDCIDTSQPTSDDEFAIVEWLHDGSDLLKDKILANSFFEWFSLVLQMLKEIE